jgi:hypothetical protein
MAVFQDVPAEVIQHEIFPFLDYCERNTLNQVLPFKERVRVPLKKDITLSTIMALQVHKARKLLNDINTRDRAKNETAVLKLFSSFNSMSYILQHNAKFRAVTLEKCTKYSNINDNEYIQSTDTFKEMMQGLCQKAVMQIAIQYPYKYEIRLIKPADTSPAIQNRYVMKDFWAKRAEARRIRLSYNSLYK